MSALLLSKRLLRAAAPIGLSIAYISSNVRQSHTLGAAGLNDRPTFEACPEIACKGKEELAAMFGEQALRRPRKISSVSSNAGEKMGSSSSAASSEYASQSSTSAFSSAKATFPCPPNREELGNHSWHLVSSRRNYVAAHLRRRVQAKLLREMPTILSIPLHGTEMLSLYVVAVQMRIHWVGMISHVLLVSFCVVLLIAAAYHRRVLPRPSQC